MAKFGVFKKVAAALFKTAVIVRAKGYDTGFLPVTRVEGIVVISVGNLRLGGAGKTPLVMHLATRLHRAGRRTAVVFRGYKGTLETKGGAVSLGAGPLTAADRAGDEAFLLASRLPGVQVYVGADRVKSVCAARDNGAEVAILDDGFSHRRLGRDLDILLASPADLEASASLFPAGNLREPAAAADRADLIGGFQSDWEKRPVDFTFAHVPTCLVDAGNVTHSFSNSVKRKVHLLCGIAGPERVLHTAREAGFLITGKSIFRDHHRFSPGELRDVFSAAAGSHAEMILTTEKDLVRIPTDEYPLPIRALRIETHLVTGRDRLDAVIEGLFR